MFETVGTTRKQDRGRQASSIVLSLLINCITCRSSNLPILSDDVEAFRRRFHLLSMAEASTALSAPTDNQRLSVRAYCRWAEAVALRALPASLDVVLLYMQHRLHVDSVDT